MLSIFEMENYQTVSFEFKGRYALLGTLKKTTKDILIAFHGQGHLAKYFIKKFAGLHDKGITIIVPEGLHNYYLDGFGSRVGALWMTSENRLVAIENYVNFLEGMYVDIRSKTSLSVNIHLLGFSQGTATVSRWVEQSTCTFKQLILWGGILPPDLNANRIKTRMKGKKCVHIIGMDDPYHTPDIESEMKKLLEKYKLTSTFKHFKGGHDIDKSTLNALFSKK